MAERSDAVPTVSGISDTPTGKLHKLLWNKSPRVGHAGEAESSSGDEERIAALEAHIRSERETAGWFQDSLWRYMLSAHRITQFQLEQAYARLDRVVIERIESQAEDLDAVEWSDDSARLAANVHDFDFLEQPHKRRRTRESASPCVEEAEDYTDHAQSVPLITVRREAVALPLSGEARRVSSGSVKTIFRGPIRGSSRADYKTCARAGSLSDRSNARDPSLSHSSGNSRTLTLKPSRSAPSSEQRADEDLAGLFFPRPEPYALELEPLLALQRPAESQEESTGGLVAPTLSGIDGQPPTTSQTFQTSQTLGPKSVANLLSDEQGLTLDDIEGFLAADNAAGV